MLDQIRLRTKLLGSFLVLVLFVLAAGLVSLAALRMTAKAVGEVVNVRVPSIVGLEEMYRGVYALSSVYGALMNTGATGSLGETRGRLDDALRLATGGRALYEPLPQSAEEARAWRAFLPGWDTSMATAQECERLLLAYEQTQDESHLNQIRTLTQGVGAESLLKTESQLDGLIEINSRIAQAESDHCAAIARQSALFVLAIVSLSVLASLLLAWFISNSIVRPLMDVVRVAGRIAVGDTNVSLDWSRGDELGVLRKSMLTMVASIKSMVTDAESLARSAAQGRLSVRVDAEKHQGDFHKIVAGINDALGAVTGPLNVAAGFIGEITTGEMPAPMTEGFAGDLDVLRTNLNTLVTTLTRVRDEERQRQWFKNGLNELNVLMREDVESYELAERILGFLVEYLRGGTGAFYLIRGEEDDGALALVASYALVRRKHLGDEVRAGEGLLGQAVRERKLISLGNVPPDYLPIGSATGVAQAAAVVAVPLVHDHQVIGAFEIAAFQDFSDRELEFLRQAGETLAIGIRVNAARERVNLLLSQSQAQEEELRVQREELQQSNEELEERAELLQQQREQIRLQNQDMERANREIRLKAEELERTSTYKSDFLSNMSHELRTPLNSILILSSYLGENKEGRLTPRELEYATTINAAGCDLLNLINEILDLSKIESGRIEFEYDSHRPADFCQQLERLFEPQAEARGIGFTTASAPELPATLRADGHRVLQILKNMLSNAIKFTEMGSVGLRVYLPDPRESPLGAAAVAFAVSDTGVGIAAAKHELVFQAFQQADGSTSRKFGGTGLGLSISRQLARGMGGELTLESDEGKGSVFTLYLPLDPAREAASAAPAIRVSPLAPSFSAPPAQAVPLADDRARVQPGGRSILIVEDDLAFAKLLMEKIRERGFAAVVADNGLSAVALAEEYLPSAIILDVMLPGMDGWGVIQHLTDNLRTRHIPIHCITCLDERQKALRMGAIGFTTKPLTKEQLELVLSDIESAVSQETGRLLIVEDDETQVTAMRALFDGRNIEITVATSGEEAIRRLSEASFDCMVLDLTLSDMSGFDVLERMQQLDERQRIPVIVHTGQDLSGEDARRLQGYADSIIIKGAKSPERLLNEVTLFLHVVESSLPPEQQQMIRTSLNNEAVLLGKKVLLVDDDMRNLFALSSILRDKGMTVIEAENGRAAQTQLAEHPDVSIVLMDVMMPEMDGYEAIRQIRANPRHARLPIIALTAKAMKGDREACLKAGASDYITKPVDVSRLLSLIRVWVYNQI